MYILTNVSYDTDGRLYAGCPTYFDTEEEAAEKAKENLAEYYGLTRDVIDKLIWERKGDPHTIHIDLDGRLEAYVISELAQPQKLTVKTPGGMLVAETKGTFDEYPGFFIGRDKESQDGLLAMVEYDPEYSFQTVLYKDGQDDAAYLVDHKTGTNRAWPGTGKGTDMDMEVTYSHDSRLTGASKGSGLDRAPADLLELTDSSGKKAYFRAGPGGRLEPVREGKGGIISIHVVCREDVAKSLRYAKCQGTDEEIDTLLKSGLQGKLDDDSGNTYDIIHQAVDDAVIEGSIDCSDEKKQQQRNIENRRKQARLLLEKNWCHEISCCECTYCIADIACSSWGRAIYDPRLPDCISYDCEEQLILVEKEDDRNRLRLPFVAEFGIEGVSMDDILAASAAYDCREEVEEFMSAAKLRGREVILRTMGEVV